MNQGNEARFPQLSKSLTLLGNLYEAVLVPNLSENFLFFISF